MSELLIPSQGVSPLTGRGMTAYDQTLSAMMAFAQSRHDEYVKENRACFEDYVPDDLGAYVYTYHAGDGCPLYHGYTTNARQRAEKHRKLAPWASWVEDVRYRKCSSPHAARKLESRLQRKVDSLCHNHRTRTYHGEDWSERDKQYPVNHVTGTCRLPGGSCNPEYLADFVARSFDAADVAA